MAVSQCNDITNVFSTQKSHRSFLHTLRISNSSSNSNSLSVDSMSSAPVVVTSGFVGGMNGGQWGGCFWTSSNIRRLCCFRISFCTRLHQLSKSHSSLQKKPKATEGSKFMIFILWGACWQWKLWSSTVPFSSESTKLWVV